MIVIVTADDQHDSGRTQWPTLSKLLRCYPHCSSRIDACRQRIIKLLSETFYISSYVIGSFISVQPWGRPGFKAPASARSPQWIGFFNYETVSQMRVFMVDDTLFALEVRDSLGFLTGKCSLLAFTFPVPSLSLLVWACAGNMDTWAYGIRVSSTFRTCSHHRPPEKLRGEQKRNVQAMVLLTCLLFPH